jgi:hypothetical protein
MRNLKLALALCASLIVSLCPALGQGIPGLPLIPLGYCQLSATQLGSAVGLSSCVRASFTASAGSVATQLVVTSVTGIIKIGDAVSGTGITAGTTVVSQVSGVGTPGGAGTYNLSASNTASSASATSGGIPALANEVYIESDTAAVRYRDDGAAPTATIGQPIASGGSIFYTGTLSAMQLIAESGSPVVNISFYKSP